MRAVLVLLATLTAVLVAASFLPLVETEWWAVRLLDFPRFQIGIALAGLVLVPLMARAPRSAGVLLLGVVAALASHAITLWPYRPDGERFVETCPSDKRVSVMVANVLLGNRQASGLTATIRAEQPDLLLVMEADAWWQDALSPIKADFLQTIEKITGSFYGIQLYSRLPLVDPEIRFLAGQTTPSVVTGVTLRDGALIAFVGAHPKPPLPWQSALERDAELYAAALLLRRRAEPGILAGDLNATPWESAVGRARRLAGLIDPRRGYGYVPTFSTKSWLASWPLDHVFHGNGFATMSLKRLPEFGSDHYPYIVRLCRTVGPAGDTPPSELGDDLAHARAVLSAAVTGGDWDAAEDALEAD